MGISRKFYLLSLVVNLLILISMIFLTNCSGDTNRLGAAKTNFFSDDNLVSNSFNVGFSSNDAHGRVFATVEGILVGDEKVTGGDLKSIEILAPANASIIWTNDINAQQLMRVMGDSDENGDDARVVFSVQ